ncbi:serine/threonine-protein kinase [Kitasatospora purpeofusca]|uniref:serine/threonine-protein kinase n=1 Tax=Kitasatospora purpeofusca TaxID=67352 RepID=UPI0035E239BB
MVGAAFRFMGLRGHDPGGLGGFRLLARLGEGGMGQVFLALSPGGVPAAVKVVRPEFTQDPAFAARFAREITAAQRVRGAHIAPLLDASAHAAQPWLATSYVAGPSLRELVVRAGPLPHDQVLLLAGGIAHALTDIHAAGVVHRDLKPANIVLDETGPKVIDFGIVKSLSQSVTYASQSTRIGTPLYMSPEQATGGPVGPASDVFSLGSTLYFLATGREAFGAENEWAVVHRVTADSPQLSVVPEPLRQLIADCLSKDPERRPTPARIRERCDALLGGTAGPGAWMAIDGAREAIRERTDALRALTTPLPQQVRPTPTMPASPPGGGDGVERTRPANPLGGAPVPPTRPDKPSLQSPRERHDKRPSTTLGKALLVMAGAALLAAGTNPMAEELRLSRSEQTQVVLVVDWHHPFGTTSYTPDPSSSYSAFAATLVLGTAAAIALAGVGQLRTGRSRGKLRTVATVANGISMLWAGVSVYAVANFLIRGIGYHGTLVAGGWTYVIANALILAAGCTAIGRKNPRTRRPKHN